MKLYNLLKEDMILFSLAGRTREEVLGEMVEFLKKNGRITKERDLLEKLLQREKLGSTAIGDGVAIPHGKVKGLKNPVVMAAISRPGVDFDSLDGNPTNVFFLVISSPDNPSINLQILAAIAQLVRKSTALPQKLMKAPDARTLLEILRKEEEVLSD